MEFIWRILWRAGHAVFAGGMILRVSKKFHSSSRLRWGYWRVLSTGLVVEGMANKFGKIDSKVRRKRKKDKKSWLRISRWAIQRQKRIRAYRSVFIVKFYKKYISKIFRRKNSLGLRRRKKLFKKLFLERARNRMAWSSELQVPNIGTSESECVAWNEMTLLEGQLILQNFG